MLEVITKTETETELVGEKLAGIVPDGTVIALYGELGAGKTAFVRGLARGMGIECRVSSPTFTIVNEYPGKRRLLHFDMYRLASAEELWDIGWEDYLARGEVCAVEWSENVEQAFTGEELRVRIDKLPGGSRRIRMEGAFLC